MTGPGGERPRTGRGSVGSTGLDATHGGSGHGPLIVLLHGLGGNRGVWSGLLPELAGRRWLAVDLPGHGWSLAPSSYSYASCAATVCAAVGDEAPVVVLGHSFGGVLGLALAALRPVSAVITVGMRTVWPPEFTASLAALAAKPTRSFPDRAESIAFLLRINGLADLLGPDSDFVERGIHRVDDGWQLSQDPRSFGVGEPPYDALIGDAVAAGTAITLAHGEQDAMVAVGDYDTFARRYGLRVAELPGLGHNAHVQDPRAVAGLLPP